MSRVLPILFNTDMVRGILDGRKTVTRRLIKKLPDDAEFSGWLLDSTCQDDAKDIGSAGFKTLKQPTEKAGCLFVKPPYQTGDILYVRETCYKGLNRILYKANYSENEKFYENGKEIQIKWHPSIHMPKEAARIWLKVKDVRVERLQEITPAQAEQEGVGDLFYEEIGCDDKNYGNPVDEKYGIAKEQFAWLWNSTIKKSDIGRYGWDANPWVWVIEFERCEKPENF